MHSTRYAAAALIISALPAAAQPLPASGGAELVRRLAECRALTEPAARLGCFDSATAQLVAAERAGEVLVIDRSQVRAARRQAFGFNMPSLDLFSRSGTREPRIDRVQVTLAGGSRSADGKWVMRTVDGQVWRQTDTNRLNKPPRSGSVMDIRTAALGSYFANIDGQRAIRVRREQ